VFPEDHDILRFAQYQTSQQIGLVRD